MTSNKNTSQNINIRLMEMPLRQGIFFLKRLVMGFDGVPSRLALENGILVGAEVSGTTTRTFHCAFLSLNRTLRGLTIPRFVFVV